MRRYLDELKKIQAILGSTHPTVVGHDRWLADSRRRGICDAHQDAGCFNHFPIMDFLRAKLSSDSFKLVLDYAVAEI